MSNAGYIDFTDYIQDAKKGDSQAFTFIYDQTNGYFRSIIVKYAGDNSETEDVLQEVYLEIFRKLGTLKDPKTFIKWGATICRNTAINELDKRSAKKRSSIEYLPPASEEEEEYGLDEFASDDLDSRINPEAHIDKMETKRLLGEILDTLPQNQRTCILLWQEQLSMREIAGVTGIPEGSVKSNISYAKKKIKTKVEELEKQGTKLYGMAPIPFFIWLLKNADTGIEVTSSQSTATLGKILSSVAEETALGSSGIGAADAADEASIAGEETVSSSEAGSGAASSVQGDASALSSAGNAAEASSADAAQASATEAGAQTDAKAGGSAAAKLGTAKIAAIVVACVIAGGAAVIGVLNSRNDQEEAPEEIIETEDVSVEEEIEEEVVEEEATEEDLEQQEFIARYQAYKDKLEELQEEYGEAVVYEDGDYFSISGLCFAQLIDLDKDGSEELLTGTTYLGGSDNVNLNGTLGAWSYVDGEIVRIPGFQLGPVNSMSDFLYVNISYVEDQYYFLRFEEDGGIFSAWLLKFQDDTITSVKFLNDRSNSSWNGFFIEDGSGNSYEVSEQEYYDELNYYLDQGTSYYFAGYSSEGNTPATQMLEYTLQQIDEVLAQE